MLKPTPIVFRKYVFNEILGQKYDNNFFFCLNSILKFPSPISLILVTLLELRIYNLHRTLQIMTSTLALLTAFKVLSGIIDHVLCKYWSLWNRTVPITNREIRVVSSVCLLMMWDEKCKQLFGIEIAVTMDGGWMVQIKILSTNFAQSDRFAWLDFEIQR